MLKSEATLSVDGPPADNPPSFWEKLLRLGHRQPQSVRWALALTFFMLALTVSVALSGVVKGESFLTFLPAIIGATLLCGWQQAMVLLVLSGAAAWYITLPSSWSFNTGGLRTPVALFLFLGVSGFLVTTVAALLDAVRANHRLMREQQTLFMELQHRVANTLQFIAGMLTLARQQAATPDKADAVLEQAVARISAMGALHRRMYDAVNAQRALSALLEDILREQFNGLSVSVRVHTDGAPIPVSQVTPIVLLVTEAATNAVKHVFRPELGSLFEVSLTEVAPDRMRLEIRDDGPGLLPGDPTPEAPQGLGMRIMKGLASQLGGRLVLTNDAGMVIAVEFSRR